MTRRIHVVGSSPRTGTTLLTELLAIGFEVDAVANHERSIFQPPPAFAAARTCRRTRRTSPSRRDCCVTTRTSGCCTWCATRAT